LVLKPGASQQQILLHGDGLCEMDSNLIIQTAVFLSFVPTMVLRIIGHILFYKSDPLDFKKYSELIYVFQSATYGIWTLYHLMAFMGVSLNCKDLLVFNMINFEGTLIVGCFSAVNVLFVIFVVMIILPIVLLQLYKEYRRRAVHAQKTKELMKSMRGHQYQSSIFPKSQECSICLCDFVENEKCLVTPLPCNTLHVFHEGCIKLWMERNNSCPLCKTHITVGACKKLNKEFSKTYPRVVEPSIPPIS